jgi:CubicO group peptidase (beta-lactamase class C family)
MDSSCRSGHDASTPGSARGGRPAPDQGFARAVDRLTAARSEGLRMSTLVVSSGDEVLVHDFAAAAARVDLRSITKAVVALAIGAGIGAGTQVRDRPLSLDLEITPYFADLLERQSAAGQERFRAVRLRHLLTSTIGHAEGFLFRADVEGRDRDSLLAYVFAHELVRAPGAHFAYSNAGWYLTSALVREQLGVRLSDWVGDLLLAPSGITDVRWKTYGRYEAGGTGLSMSARDLAAIGRLLLAGGVYDGRQVVPRAWIACMRAPAVRAASVYDPPLRAHAYGLGLWICDGGTYYCDGTGGQFLIVDPRTETVVVALAEAGDTVTVARCLRDLL